MLGKNFREGAAVIPFLLIAYICLGIFYNLSIWYKLTNKTLYGAILALCGAGVTIIFNFLWIPKFGYMGSAYATLLCYGSMMIASYLIGLKHYKVNYNLKRIISYIGLSVLLYIGSTFLAIDNLILKLVVHTIFVAAFLSVVYLIERRNFKAENSR